MIEVIMGAIKTTTTTTGSSKDELAVSNTSNRIKGQGGNFPGAADTAKVCSFVALCVAYVYGERRQEV